MRNPTIYLTLILLAACASGQETMRIEHDPARADAYSADAPSARSAELRREVERVRTATAQYRDIERAKADGWTDQYPEGCAASSEGAQAYHWLNPSLVDGQVDLLRPELFMYEPQADGSMELVGVDYIIPLDQWAGGDPPTLLGQPLMRNEELGVWAIHIWAWRENPSGMFAPWNPDVSCRHVR